MVGELWNFLRLNGLLLKEVHIVSKYKYSQSAIFLCPYILQVLAGDFALKDKAQDNSANYLITILSKMNRKKHQSIYLDIS
jgi:hypothetical protein